MMPRRRFRLFPEGTFTKRRLTPVAWIVVPVSLLILLAWFFNARDQRFERQQMNDRAAYQTRIDTLEVKLSEIITALGQEQAAAKARGDQPVTPPADQIAVVPDGLGPVGPVGPTGKDGAVGPVGATGAPGVGTPGTAGERGPIGPVGATGATGNTGNTGDTGAQGPGGVQGPGPSDDQVAAAVAAYCAAHGGCIGPQGPPGPPGVPLPL